MRTFVDLRVIFVYLREIIRPNVIKGYAGTEF